MIPIRRRLIIAGIVSVLTITEGWAAGTVTLGKHTVACRSDQDIAAANAHGENSRFHQIIPSLEMMRKYLTGDCREYSSGETVKIEEERNVGGLNLECIKVEREDRCFWALTDDAHGP